MTATTTSRRSGETGILRGRISSFAFILLSICFTILSGCGNQERDVDVTIGESDSLTENRSGGPTPGEMMEGSHNDTVGSDGAGDSITLDSTGAIGTTQGYRTYTNARFDFSVEYPVPLLQPQGEADNGDGQIFLSNDGTVEMRAFGYHPPEKHDLQWFYELRLDQHQYDQVTYKVARDDFYVISGYANGKIFYEKTFVARDALKTVELVYIPEKKKQLDPIVTRVAGSFRK